ncbi:MAG: hypothetical protein ACRD2I_24910, partial [Vicinamibacterales bacterium]
QIRDPLANLLFQGWLMTSAALLAPFVMARFLSGRGGGWIAIGALTNALFLLVATPAVQFDWFVTQPYAVSITIGFAALIVADERNRPGAIIGAFLLLLIACWVNIGAAVMLAIAAVIQGRRRLRLLALEGAAGVLASLAARYLATSHTVTSLAPVRVWANGWWQLLEGTAGVTDRPAVAIGAAVAAAGALGWLWKKERLPPLTTLTAIAALALGTWLVVGTSLWVGMNRYSFRYMYPTLMVLGTGVATIVAALFVTRIRALSIAATIVLIALSAVRYGRPSLDRVERGFDDRFGRTTAAVLHSGATVIGGDYWRVWPAVFHANLTLSRTHTRGRIFGLAYRSEETDPLWKNTGNQILIAAWPDDRTVASVADEHGVHITLLQHQPEIDLYTGQQ